MKRMRVTVTLPKDLWEEVKRFVPPGQRSQVIAEAIEKELRTRKRLKSIEHLKKLQERLRRKYGELPSPAEEIQALREERDADLSGLR